MSVTPPVAALRAETPAEARELTAEARAHVRRRRQKTALAVALIVAAAAGGGFAWAGALSGGKPADQGSPSPSPSRSQPAPLTAHTGGVTGYIDPCEGVGTGLPYAAGTVMALRGRETWKPDGHGTDRLQFPAAVAARQHVGESHKFDFDLAPGQYVLVARYDRGNGMTFLDVSVAAGRVLDRDLPDLCK
jgi:hypothetical protein